jgi:two-component system chemotaxis response regulator CheB
VIRLLIVDDSALMRKLLEGIFRDEGDFEIRLGRNGGEALELVRSFDPQVVTLDVQMPGMDGLACLAQIMIEAPRPVVMISALTEEGAEATLEAIELGAIDFVAKPSGAVSLEIDRLRPLLVEKVRGAANARIRPTLRLKERIRLQFQGAGILPRSARPQSSLRPRGKGELSPGLVLIGTSTGGPAALDIVLPQLPQEFPWPVMVAQHMPASFTGPFAKRLNRQCALEVVEVDRPMPLKAGTIYIGRGDADLIVTSRSTGMCLCEFLYRRTGMSFADNKRYYVDRRLAERIVATKSESFQSYFAILRSDVDHEIEHLVNAFTVNETYFYREEHQLRCMTSNLLDNVVRAKKPGESIRIWSIPCSTGEEPYSIAIWLMENWRQVDSYNIEIVGSDIDTRALKAAADGV